MESSRDKLDTDFAGYPANLKAGYRISGQMSGVSKYRTYIRCCRIPYWYIQPYIRLFSLPVSNYSGEKYNLLFEQTHMFTAKTIVNLRFPVVESFWSPF